MRTLHIITACTMIAAAPYCRAQLLSQDPLYKLVFEDDFDALSLDTGKWAAHYPWSPSFNNSNAEKGCTNFPDSLVPLAFHYDYPGPDKDHNRVYDTTGSGYQRLVSRREAVTGYTWDYSAGTTVPTPFKFTTAMLWGKYRFKYGYFEMRYRLKDVQASTVNSYGPNFWLWSGDGLHWSELDIFEQRGTDWKKGPNTVYQATATDSIYRAYTWETPGPYHPYTDPFTDPGNPGSNGGQWLTAGCEWTPEYADFYYDSNEPYRRYTDASTFVGRLDPMPVIVDIYMPAKQFCILYDTVNTQQPFEYDIDYIRVYQVKQNCVPKSFLNTSSSTYQDTLYQSLTIAGPGGSALFNSSTHHLAGQDFVLLQEGFEASGAATTLTISTMQCQSGQAMYYSPISPTPPEDAQEIIDRFGEINIINTQ